LFLVPLIIHLVSIYLLKNDIISSARKYYSALDLGLKLDLGLGWG